VIAIRSGGMITNLSALVSVFSFRFRSRASVELEVRYRFLSADWTARATIS
jgi:hypothetical protein